jgi:nucleoside-diphosphate-sugar epimerase
MGRIFDKVLVTGGAGYCGARLIPQLLSREKRTSTEFIGRQ